MLEGELTVNARDSNGWGAFNGLHLRRVSLPSIVQYWDDMLRVAGSLATGQVRAYDLIKMMTADGRTTGLGSAFASYGRIFKSLHLLQLTQGCRNHPAQKQRLASRVGNEIEVASFSCT
jgi:hypothetical protein